MKKIIVLLITCCISFICAFSIEAATFISGSSGADGPFNPPAQVPAGTVVTGNTITVPLPANGTFNFTTFDVANGITVKFTRNAANTPVYLLTMGDVNVAGIIDVSGEKGTDGVYGNIRVPVPGGKGGPGGFDGGYGGQPDYGDSLGITVPGIGLGPGGASSNPPHIGNLRDGYGNGGSYVGGNALQPLIGGSGGGGSYAGDAPTSGGGGGGGGGGGTILIASSGNINITGAISANGGDYGAGGYCGGGGSGGAIRLIGNRINGSGENLYTAGGLGCVVTWWGGGVFWDGGHGSVGKIRIEAYSVSTISGNTGIIFDVPRPIFLPQVPSLAIISVASVTVPAAATGSYTAPDISLPSTITNPIPIVMSATNIPVGTIITVVSVPQSGTPSSATATLSGTDTNPTATASLSISTTYPSVISAQTTFSIQTAMFYDGEKIDRVRVASALGGKSETFYITKSGKEIPAATLLAGLMK